MSLRSADRLSPGETVKTDICVVGAGAAGITLALVVTIAMSVERYLFTHMTKLMVMLSVTAAVLLVLPSTWSRACGLLVCLLVLALNYSAHRRSQSL